MLGESGDERRWGIGSRERYGWKGIQKGGRGREGKGTEGQERWGSDGGR